MHKAKLKRTLDYLKAEKLEDLSCPKASPLVVERVPGFVHKDRLARSLRHERRGIHCCRTDVVESNMVLKTATEQHRFYVRLKTWLVCHWCAGFIHWSALLRESRSHGFFAMELCSSTPCVVSSLPLYIRHRLWLLCLRRRCIGQLADYILGLLVLAQTLKRRMSDRPVRCPLCKNNLSDEFGFHP